MREANPFSISSETRLLETLIDVFICVFLVFLGNSEGLVLACAKIRVTYHVCWVL